MKFPIGTIHVIEGKVAHCRGWLNNAVTAQFSTSIIDETFKHWRQQMTYLHGWPSRPDPGHTMARFGDPGVTYEYKGKPKPMHPFSPSLDALRKFIQKELDWSPNCVVVNSYGPSSGLYPHRDSPYIPALGSNPTIVSISFGATRTFRLSPVDPITGKRVKGSTPTDISLEDGDLLVMHGDCDSTFQHGIPLEDADGTRMSLTFRAHVAG
jgi:alkylated DNA repair dioxygenase AlkB